MRARALALGCLFVCSTFVCLFANLFVCVCVCVSVFVHMGLGVSVCVCLCVRACHGGYARRRQQHDVRGRRGETTFFRTARVFLESKAGLKNEAGKRPQKVGHCAFRVSF